MKIIDKGQDVIISEITVEKGEFTFELEKPAHLYNKDGECVGYINNYLDNGIIKFECSNDVVRVYLYNSGKFITLIDYRYIKVIELGY